MTTIDIIIIVFYVVFFIVDIVFYNLAPSIGRKSHWGYKLPGGGIVAWVRFRIKRQRR